MSTLSHALFPADHPDNSPPTPDAGAAAAQNSERAAEADCQNPRQNPRQNPQRVPAEIPARAGIGLRHPHYREIVETKPPAAWFEVHPENFMGAGGAPHHYLEAVRALYPLSLHAVGLSLGSCDGLDPRHLERLALIVDLYQPGLVSDHLAWTSFGGTHYHDLLPLPLTEESLALVMTHVGQIQDRLRRQILIENPSTYVDIVESSIPETEFLAALAERSGCGLLLDVNNVFVCATNHGFRAEDYLDQIPVDKVGEIHLSGHDQEEVAGTPLLIDDHGSKVVPEVWALYRRFLARAGRVIPTLIEWDSDVPPFSVLCAEAARAQDVLDLYPHKGTAKALAMPAA